MKLSATLFIAAFSLGTLTAKAQNAEIPAPEFKNKVMYVKKDNTLSDIDNTDITTHMKTSMAGSSKMMLRAEGNHAAVKRTGNPKNRFIVWIDAGIDPASAIELLQFEAEKKYRTMTVSTAGLAKDKTIPKQKLTFSKIKDGVYLISPASQLEPGEYVFMINRPNIDFMSAANGSSDMRGFAFYVADGDSE